MSQSVIVQGMAWGDESKGQCIDLLTRKLSPSVIVRFCGGPQAGHNVVLEDGRSHCFSQFGAGMLANNQVETFLSRFMLIEPLSMKNEAVALSKLTDNVWGRISVDAEAVVITPFHRHLNRLREKALGKKRHGSCGRGVGAARETHLKYGDSVLLAGDLRYTHKIREKLAFVMEKLMPEITLLRIELDEPIEERKDWEVLEWTTEQFSSCPARIVDGFEPSEMMVFEGAQGVLLDEKHGTAPHNTWTNTTFENADTLLDEVGVQDRFRIGCFRSYYTRHGEGPFPTEDNTLDLPEPHNDSSGIQGMFRVGEFDFTLAKAALSIVQGVDSLSISHLDYLPRLGWDESDFLACIEASLRTPIGILGRGPTANDRTVLLKEFANAPSSRDRSYPGKPHPPSAPIDRSSDVMRGVLHRIDDQREQAAGRDGVKAR